ncbi:LTA synthase family protein [Bacillus thermotolerans]|uniref:Lipoteichoic acid synthase LtaS Type IIIa n=1 Tax=Bacillus thermotolerans TaxID=1221996 RepID=A0A0F5IC43_BACTR|nr:LTA synthase family protein [Bacillus thermotolerans]KKB37282.1 Lipoteichoic acid synthase LtaS Type IIIa [Bacillus thermotolerans]KKB41927.1 Lipoteichoic acid synthase LtaS Type IIIa [Bacillus thermotolerans]KKB42920.1 Lipoteichoic acid synthase LtaS Type IIIa [Bacillus thermotolerans]
MKGALRNNVSLIAVAVLFLWIKTYIVYQTSFNIDIENTLQAFILFINPLSFIMLAMGISVFFKSEKGKKRYIMITSFLLTFLLYANVVFYRFFNDFITVPLLFQTSNFADLGNSVTEEFKWYDILYFADLILLAVLLKVKPKFINFGSMSKMNTRAYFLSAVAVFFLNLGLAEVERPQLLTRTFDREMLVKNIGTFNYHVYDVLLQSKSSAQRALADGSELADIENYSAANYAEPNDEYFGIAKGKNLIMVSVESTQQFVMNNTVNGQEITPFLNEFAKKSLYFPNFYHQTGQGKTSDAEFLVENSLYPLSRGAVFFTHSGNEYDSLAEKLDENGYFSNAMHANNKSFWNRDIMYKSLGYERFYEVGDYDVNEENSVNWGMKDIPFFEQSAAHMKEMPKPFYSKMITLTNHHPFYYDEEDKFIDEFNSKSGTLNRYFVTVRYTDEALKQFVEDLKASGLYENSVIVLYGDHYGISENHNEAMAQYLGKEVTPFVSAQLQKVPFMIHIPGVEGKVIDKVGGQIDVRPTLLHLFGIDTKDDVQFGQDLLSEEHEDFVAFRDGRFITKDYVYADNKCWDKATEQPTEKSYCSPYLEKTATELNYSDRIIYGDLLRFYDPDAAKKQPDAQ